MHIAGLSFTQLVGSVRDMSLFSKEVCVSEEIPLDHLEETLLQLVHKLIMSHSVTDHLILYWNVGLSDVNHTLCHRVKQTHREAAKRAHCTECGPKAKGLRKNTASGEGAGKRSPPVFVQEGYTLYFTQFHFLLLCLLTQQFRESDVEAGLSKLSRWVSQN